MRRSFRRLDRTSAEHPILRTSSTMPTSPPSSKRRVPRWPLSNIPKLRCTSKSSRVGREEVTGGVKAVE